MACRTMRSWQLRWRSFSYNWEESPIDSSCNCSISGANWAPYLKPEDVRMYIFSWKLSPAKIQLCPITEVLGRSESCQTTWHEQAPGVFFWDLNDLHSHRMKCHVAAGAKAKSFQRWILQKEGVRYKRKHATNRHSFLFFWFYGRTLRGHLLNDRYFLQSSCLRNRRSRKSQRLVGKKTWLQPWTPKTPLWIAVPRWSEKMSRWRRKSRNFLHKKSRLSGEESPWLLRMWFFPLPPTSFDHLKPEVFRPNRSTDCNTSGWGK